jgi:hypothetical protein
MCTFRAGRSFSEYNTVTHPYCMCYCVYTKLVEKQILYLKKQTTVCKIRYASGKNMKGHGRTWKDMEGHERTWKDMEGHERTWKDMEGHERTWKENSRSDLSYVLAGSFKGISSMKIKNFRAWPSLPDSYLLFQITDQPLQLDKRSTTNEVCC